MGAPAGSGPHRAGPRLRGWSGASGARLPGAAFGTWLRRQGGGGGGGGEEREELEPSRSPRGARLVWAQRRPRNRSRDRRAAPPPPPPRSHDSLVQVIPARRAPPRPGHVSAARAGQEAARRPRGRRCGLEACVPAAATAGTRPPPQFLPERTLGRDVCASQLGVTVSHPRPLGRGE